MRLAVDWYRELAGAVLLRDRSALSHLEKSHLSRCETVAGGLAIVDWCR